MDGSGDEVTQEAQGTKEEAQDDAVASGNRALDAIHQNSPTAHAEQQGSMEAGMMGPKRKHRMMLWAWVWKTVRFWHVAAATLCLG